MTETTVDLSAFFQADLNLETFNHYADAAYASFRTLDQFRDLTREEKHRVDAGRGDAVRLGAALLILGQFGEAVEVLGKATDNKYRRYYGAQALSAVGRTDEALKDYERAAARGWDEFDCDMQRALLNLRRGETDATQESVKKNAKRGADRGDWYYVRGQLCEHDGDRPGAVEMYEKVLELSPDHAGAMFGLARVEDQLGHEAEAIELYKLLSLQPRASVNALLNLAVIYEDIDQYDEAIECLQRVLRAYPNHPRARLFLKDVESSRQMVIDEAAELKVDARRRLLETPISEFELSVRARNCLKKMRVNSLGDLLRLTEAELMSFKNFGETSLTEIKAMLTAKGLHLGIRAEEIDLTAIAEPPPPKVTVPPGSEASLNKSVAELELSVRARRCLQRLNIVSLGELIQHSEADLLATRNFGVTSLNEIKARLGDHGLQLVPKR